MSNAVPGWSVFKGTWGRLLPHLTPWCRLVWTPCPLLWLSSRFDLYSWTVSIRCRKEFPHSIDPCLRHWAHKPEGISLRCSTKTGKLIDAFEVFMFSYFFLPCEPFCLLLLCVDSVMLCDAVWGSLLETRVVHPFILYPFNHPSKHMSQRWWNIYSGTNQSYLVWISTHIHQ